MIKAIIFDFDGTLSNRQANAYGIFEDYLYPYFKDLSDIEYEAIIQDLMITDCNGSIPVHYRLLPFINKYSKYLPDDFEDEFTPFYFEYMWKYAVLKPHTIEMLETLKKNYKIGLLSNGDSASQHNKIDHCGLPSYFDEVIVTGDYNVHKPNPEIYKIMADKLGVKCEECLFIGDTFSSDILGAIRANMIPVWISQLSERPANRYSGYRIQDMKELYAILDKENKK